MTRLVFAHYLGGSARSWVPLVDDLGAGFACVAPDVPGFGNTPPPAVPSLDTYADWLIAAAGGEPWWAVGHSMGGKIALAAAVKRPPGLAGLILIAPSPPTPEPMTEDDRAASLAAYGDPRLARRTIGHVSTRLPPVMREIAIDDELRVAEPAWRWWLKIGSRDDISLATAGIDMPVLVIAGDDDEVMGPATAPGVAHGLRHGKLHVIADAGHLVPLERPRAVAERIAAFV